MGAYCCTQSSSTQEGNLDTTLTPNGAFLNGEHFTPQQIRIITKIQACMRMYLAKRRVDKIRSEIYSPSAMMEMQDFHGVEDYDNANVQVTEDLAHLSCFVFSGDA